MKALSREIKFRAFYKEENCMFYSCEVLEWVIWEFSCGEIKVVVQELGTEEKEWNVKDLPIMQFTGLKDKNGKEIYESDYVKDQSGLIWEVYFDMGQFLLKNKVIADTPVSLYSEPVIEIIGNIYSTPELLDK